MSCCIAFLGKDLRMKPIRRSLQTHDARMVENVGIQNDQKYE